MIFVALLHAVNLGARRKVPMADLRALLTGLGLADVRTYIQSGNAAFRAEPDPALRGRLEAALAARFGFPVPVTLRTAPEWRGAATSCPAHLRDEAVVVAFLRDPPDPARVAALRGRDVTPERWEVVGQQLYQTVPQGVRNLRLSAGVIERALGVGVTVRNERTVGAVAAMLDT
ncbi:hypothetical protein GCM10008956_14890 [Deinococcus arenae]|uniref:DUF1697 domain-containing protein n=1 Tax=Deinococcus arenae TaxID=1452751 RepID=A0A8H9L7H0_9DEIO|nr:DUF1697 domain-containing protein [Deinococcus arenae]AWT36404.1 hypothetical protein DM785_13190 [Deinococcus actinosclerus]GGM39477.1 hypothetical protein GCM10008956_14890 [Deinococcus arenae]